MNKFSFIVKAKTPVLKVRRKQDNKKSFIVKINADKKTFRGTSNFSEFLKDLEIRTEITNAIVDAIKEFHVSWLNRININAKTHSFLRAFFGKEVGYTPPKEPKVGKLFGVDLYIDNTLKDYEMRLDIVRPDQLTKTRFIAKT